MRIAVTVHTPRLSTVVSLAGITLLASCGESDFKTGSGTTSASSTGSGGGGGTEPIGGDGGGGDCSGSEELCGDACVDTSTDPEHCGGCDQPCRAPDACAGGVCGPLACGRGTADCNMDGVDCETNTDTDATNCGGCGTKCSLTCETGVCNDPIDVSAGGWFSCALLRLGDVHCWGDRTFGQLGDGIAELNNLQQVPQKVNLPGPARRVVASPQSVRAHACAILENEDLYCWGSNSNGQVGSGSGDPVVPTPVLVLKGIAEVALGGSFTCAIESGSSDLLCWGNNESRQLGIDGDDLNTPQVVVGGVKHVAAGGATTCVIYQTGDAECWGANQSGQAGDFVFSASAMPTQISFTSPAERIALGESHACARLASGGVECWGESDDGRLGFVAAMDTAVPTPLVIPATILHVDLGSKHSGAASDAGLFVWGDNSKTQLGDGGNANPQYVPLDVGVSGVEVLSFGQEHSCAIQKGGSLTCWGADDHGQLGNGPGAVQQSTPAPVAWP